MLPEEDPTESSPICLAIIIYYYYHKLGCSAVSELTALKNDGDGIDPWGVLVRYDNFRDDCRKRDIPWNSEGVGQELARLVDLDTFNAITRIDALVKAYSTRQYKSFWLEDLRNENNPVRAIAIPILNIKKEETASKAQEAECQATDAESESLIVDPVTPYVECPQDSLPPSRALKTPAADRVSPRLIPSPEGS